MMRLAIFVLLLITTASCSGSDPLAGQGASCFGSEECALGLTCDFGQSPPICSSGQTYGLTDASPETETDEQSTVKDDDTVAPDASVVEVDASVVEVDASVVEVDASVVEVDASVVEVDASVVEVDASVSEVDASVGG